MRKACKAKLQAAGLMDTITAAAHTCPHTSASSRGCPKAIPSLSAGQQDCSSGSGFWPIGSVCTASCSGGNGGGHRRAQTGGTASYLCSQGGNWVSPTPLSCGGGRGSSGGPPPDTGRFVAVDQPMSIADAVVHCRQNYGSLASIHSWNEQQAAMSACLSVMPPDADVGYGCWIGFEDSATEGGFVWRDGSPVDFVHWNPGEPNGGLREGAVAMDFRCMPWNFPELAGENAPLINQDCGDHQVRHGEWNDAGTEDSYHLRPICQTEIPQVPANCIRPPTSSSAATSALHCANRIWGSGSQQSVNIRLCVDADDTIYYQDNRIWLQYSGIYGAAGSGECPGEAGDPTAYSGKAYVNDEL